MMKEFRFEPASQMITVDEGQSLDIDITGIKTAYRYNAKAWCVTFDVFCLFKEKSPYYS